ALRRNRLCRLEGLGRRHSPRMNTDETRIRRNQRREQSLKTRSPHAFNPSRISYSPCPLFFLIRVSSVFIRGSSSWLQGCFELPSHRLERGPVRRALGLLQVLVEAGQPDLERLRTQLRGVGQEHAQLAAIGVGD